MFFLIFFKKSIGKKPLYGTINIQDKGERKMFTSRVTKKYVTLGLLALVVLSGVGFLYARQSKNQAGALGASNPHYSRELSQEVYRKLSAEEQFMIGNHWRDAFVEEALLLPENTMILNQSYTNKRVYRISFVVENGSLNHKHVVYVSIDERKIVGYSLFEEEEEE